MASPFNEATGLTPSPSSLETDASVWSKAQTFTGSLEVQLLLKDAACDAVRKRLAEGLRGHVWKACRCPHANHVVQKCIINLKPTQVQFVIDEILAAGRRATARLARHQYGCRILQRLIEHCSPGQVSRLAQDLLVEVAALSVHQYGAYVMACLVEHGAEEHGHTVATALIDSAACVASTLRGPLVLHAVLLFADAEDQQALAAALHDVADLLPRLARGSPGLRLALWLLPKIRDPERLRQELHGAAPNFTTSKAVRSLRALARQIPRSADADTEATEA